MLHKVIFMLPEKVQYCDTNSGQNFCHLKKKLYRSCNSEVPRWENDITEVAECSREASLVPPKACPSAGEKVKEKALFPLSNLGLTFVKFFQEGKVGMITTSEEGKQLAAPFQSV